MRRLCDNLSLLSLRGYVTPAPVLLGKKAKVIEEWLGGLPKYKRDRLEFERSVGYRFVYFIYI